MQFVVLDLSVALPPLARRRFLLSLIRTEARCSHSLSSPVHPPLTCRLPTCLDNTMPYPRAVYPGSLEEVDDERLLGAA